MNKPNKEKQNNLESFEKTNSDLTTIVDIQELNIIQEKIQSLNFAHNKLTEIEEFFNFTNLVYLDHR
jgi:Leucine-rich repeat (LRR) protein